MNIFVFGDSIAEGFNDSDRGGWCARLMQEMMRREIASNFSYNRHLFNLSIAGNTSEDVLTRAHIELRNRVGTLSDIKSTVIIFAVGINDSQFDIVTGNNKVSVQNMTQNISQTWSQVSSFAGQVVIMGLTPVVDDLVQPMPWFPTHAYSNDVILAYNQALKKLAEAIGAQFIDVYTVFGADYMKYLSDGVHPNEAGHEVLYNQILLALESSNIL